MENACRPMSAEIEHNIIESEGWVVRDFRSIIVIVYDCQNTTAVSAVFALELLICFSQHCVSDSRNYLSSAVLGVA